MRRWSVLAAAILAVGGCDLLWTWLTPTPFSLAVVPTEIVDSLPGQNCVLLATYGNDDAPAVCWGDYVRVSAEAPMAAVAVEPAVIGPGEVAEISVVPDRNQLPPPEEFPEGGVTLNVTVRAERGGLVRTQTIPITVTSLEKDQVGSTARGMLDRFIPWLAENCPELGITERTVWHGTIVSPHILVVTHYLFFSDEWEVHIGWHVMIPPDDWARIELRRRYLETEYSWAFRIDSVSAEPNIFREVEPEGPLWR